jgi:hypothetical protein
VVKRWTIGCILRLAAKKGAVFRVSAFPTPQVAALGHNLSRLRSVPKFYQYLHFLLMRAPVCGPELWIFRNALRWKALLNERSAHKDFFSPSSFSLYASFA